MIKLYDCHPLLSKISRMAFFMEITKTAFQVSVLQYYC